MDTEQNLKCNSILFPDQDLQNCSKTIPFSCFQDRQHALRRRNYKGEWLNLTNINTPLSFVNAKKTLGLAALGYSKGVSSKFSWRKIGGNKIINGIQQGNCGCCWASSSTSVSF